MTSFSVFSLMNDLGWELAGDPADLRLVLSRPPAPPAWTLIAAGWRARDGAWQAVADGLELRAWAEGASYRIELATAPECAADWVRIDLAAQPDERFLGFGERFDALDQRGHVVDLNVVNGASGGKAYKPIPFFISSAGYGVQLLTSSRTIIHLATPDDPAVVSIRCRAASLSLRLIPGDSPAEILSRYTAFAGRPELPPAWVFGPWKSRDWTTEDQAAALEDIAAGRALRLAGTVKLIDASWQSYFQSLDFHPAKFPDPAALLRQAHAQGYRVILWIAPWIALDDPPSETYRFCVERGFFVRRPAGEIYVHRLGNSPTFIGSCLDFTNPEAVAWWQARIRRLVRLGVSGFKTDFGEQIPDDAVFWDGRTGREFHNLYPRLYNQATHAALPRAGRITRPEPVEGPRHASTGSATVIEPRPERVEGPPHASTGSATVIEPRPEPVEGPPHASTGSATVSEAHPEPAEGPPRASTGSATVIEPRPESAEGPPHASTGSATVIEPRPERVEGPHGILLARSAWDGSQAYSAIWAGDQSSDFNLATGLASAIIAGQSAGLSGFPFWASDIGGYFGTPTDELFIRWAQFGAFSPIMQTHGLGKREPWAFAPETLAIYRRYAQLHMDLLPYIYTAARRAVETGLPIMRALALEFPQDAGVWGAPSIAQHSGRDRATVAERVEAPAAPSIAQHSGRDLAEHEYCFGDRLLVAPVYWGGERVRLAYLPAGAWRDFWTGAAYAGGQTVRLAAGLDTIPVLARAGSLIPLLDPSADTCLPTENPALRVAGDDLRLWIYGGADGAFELHDGTRFAWDDAGATLTITDSPVARQVAARRIGLDAPPGTPRQVEDSDISRQDGFRGVPNLFGAPAAFGPDGRPIPWAATSLSGEPGYVRITLSGPGPHRITFRP